MATTFALDQNFPLNVITALGHIPEAALVPLQLVDPTLTRGKEDWEILLALYKRGYDGFVTADSSMLALPKELAVLIQTRLTLVVTDGVGHDSIEATGLLLIHLPHIAHQSKPDLPQLWRLRPPSRRNHTEPWDTLTHVAERQNLSARALFRRERLPESLLS